MFRRLRNKLIWINLGITTAVIVTVFTAIYIFATNAANRRPPMIEQTESYADDFQKIINITIRNEKQAAAQDLLVTLIVSGVAIELVVAIVSYFLAEEAIKPVREAYEAQRVFIANASHEIKTPLAAIAANLEAADIQGNKWIDNVAFETEKLSLLNSELLTLARTDLVEHGTVDEVSIGSVVRESLKSFESRMEGIKCVKKIETHSKAKIAVDDFRQIFGILMDNAVKYCDKKITVTVAEHELIVENDGTTIGKEQLPHVFDRFYQIDKSSEGVGLGLSIAKATAERNGWTLLAESENGETRFRLKY